MPAIRYVQRGFEICCGFRRCKDHATQKKVPDPVICIEHGWVERGGEIIDPTLPDADITYFAGLRFKGNLGIAKALQIPKEHHCKDLPIFHRFGWGGIESPEFRSAIAAAYRYAGMEDTARRYEEWGT